MRATLLNAAALALFAASPAGAQTWELIGTSTKGSVYAIDTETMKANALGGTEVWIRQSHKKPQPVFDRRKSPLYTEALSRATINCGQLSMNLTYTIYRDNRGNSVYTDSSPGMDSPIVPGSMGQAVYERVCPAS